MPKNYKEMIDELINKIDEGFKVKYAMSPNQKIAVASYKSKLDAEKFKNDIIKKGGKAILTTEDAPTNNAGSGNVDMNPTGAVMSPKMMKRKKEQGDEQEKITKKISNLVKENSDNNNIMLKQVLDSIDKVEDKLDEKNGIKKDIVIEDKKEYKTFKDKYYAGNDLAEATGNEIKKYMKNEWKVEVKASKVGNGKYLRASGKIPNKFREMVIKKFMPDAKIQNTNNISYGNIRDNYVALRAEEWDKLIKNKG